MSKTDLAQALVDAIGAVKTMIPAIQDTASNIARLDERVANVRSDVDKVSKIFFTGDGRPAIVTVIANLDQAVTSLQAVVSQLQAEASGRKRVLIETRGAIWVAIITGIFALLVAMFK